MGRLIMFLLSAMVIVARAYEMNGAKAVQGVEKRQEGPSNNPDTSVFLRRTGGAMAVMGNHIYYDGGSISQDGFLDYRPINPTNVTLSIDLTGSWEPESVSNSEIIRPATPVMEYHAMLTDEKQKCFYVVGGRTQYLEELPDLPESRRYCEKSGNQGDWSEVELPSAGEVDLRKQWSTAYAAFASTPGAGFIFGGSSYNRSNHDYENLHHYVSFNFTTETWKKHEQTPGYTSDSSLWGSKALFVPEYGRHGLIFILGGMAMRGTGEYSYLPFDRLYFLDPVTDKWYNQAAWSPDDQVPDGRHQHCVAGLSGPNGTYDIIASYMFGGANDRNFQAFSDLHVLSLPSFTWTKPGSLPSAFAREGHGCAIAGKSQLITWGGLPYPASAGVQKTKDLFPKGLGILDLNSLSPKDGYDAEAPAYRPNSKILSVRAKPAEWSSSLVEDLFPKRETETDDPTKPSNGTETSQVPIGAIIGAVVGGVLILVIGAGLLWFFVLRKRRSPEEPRQEADSNTEDKTKAELSPEPQVIELQDSVKPAELVSEDGRQRLNEPVHEMDGGSAGR